MFVTILFSVSLFIENNLQIFFRECFAKEKYKVTSLDIFLLEHVFCSVTLLGFHVKVSSERVMASEDIHFATFCVTNDVAQ